MSARRAWVAVVLAVACARPAFAVRKQPAEFDAGFFASRHRDACGTMRLKALGPFYEHAYSDGGYSMRAVRPVYGRESDPVTNRTSRDILWPVASTRQIADKFACRFLLAFYQDFDVNDPDSRYRLWVLPVYFQGREKEKGAYAALFPLGGKIHSFLGRDEVRFVLWPLYDWYTINGVETHQVLWPFYSRTEGKGIHRLRLFPFYGRNVHRDRYEKKFVLWPFWTWARHKVSGSAGTAYVVFPLWGHFDLEDQETWMFVPPLVRFTESQRLNYGYCPWPFVQWSSGQTDKFYVWPLWGYKRTQGFSRSFVLWPLYRAERIDRGRRTIERRRLFPLVIHDVERHHPQGLFGRTSAVVGRYVKVWPLFRYSREEDSSRLRVLDLWPLRDMEPVERSFEPLWSLYERQRRGDSADNEVLWGLYRRMTRGPAVAETHLFPLVDYRRDDRDGVKREWSLLKGLVGCRTEGTQRTWRVLYFMRFSRGGKQP